MQWIAERAAGLLQLRQSAGPAALEQIREWHPRFDGWSDEEIRQAPFTEADARLVYAREHGFESWDDLARRVALLASDAQAAAAEPFLMAFQALQSGNAAALSTVLARDKHLARDRGTNGNTLLNLAVSIAAGLDQDVGLALVEAVLAAGADVNDANDRGATPLHQAGYTNQGAIAELLIRNGADLEAEAHGSGGTPLIFALFWGHREVADVLGRISAAPWNLRAYAGLGDADAIARCFTGATSLSAEACAARGFYRPHGGFPEWRPSSDQQEVVDEALVWACKSGRTEVLPRLLRAGARLNADPYRGTPLIWAAWRNRLATAAWLIDHGAAVDHQANFGGLTHGQGVTALHMAAQNGHLAMVKLLLDRGADPLIKDDLHGGDAAGHAHFFGQPAVRDYLLALGGRRSGA
jgi:ankyrin repeat protein